MLKQHILCIFSYRNNCILCTRGRIHRYTCLEYSPTFGGSISFPWAWTCAAATTCFCDSRQSRLLAGWHHVLVSDRVSNITSLSYMSHSRVKESRRGVSNIILSWLESGVSRGVMLLSSNLDVVTRSPASDVFSIFIRAGVFRLPRTLSLRSVPLWTQVTKAIRFFFFFKQPSSIFSFNLKDSCQRFRLRPQGKY